MSMHPARQAYVTEEQEVSSARTASESPIFTVHARPNAELTVTSWQADGSISLDNIREYHVISYHTIPYHVISYWKGCVEA